MKIPKNAIPFTGRGRLLLRLGGGDYLGWSKGASFWSLGQRGEFMFSEGGTDQDFFALLQQFPSTVWGQTIRLEVHFRFNIPLF